MRGRGNFTGLLEPHPPRNHEGFDSWWLLQRFERLIPGTSWHTMAHLCLAPALDYFHTEPDRLDQLLEAMSQGVRRGRPCGESCAPHASASAAWRASAMSRRGAVQPSGPARPMARA